MARKIYAENQGGIRETWYYDDAEDKVHVVHEQVAQPVLDYVARKASFSNGKGEEFWHVAETPIVVARAWATARGIDPEAFCAGKFPDEWMRMIRDMPKLSPTGGKM